MRPEQDFAVPTRSYLNFRPTPMLARLCLAAIPPPRIAHMFFGPLRRRVAPQHVPNVLRGGHTRFHSRWAALCIAAHASASAASRLSTGATGPAGCFRDPLGTQHAHRGRLSTGATHGEGVSQSGRIHCGLGAGHTTFAASSFYRPVAVGGACQPAVAHGPLRQHVT